MKYDLVRVDMENNPAWNAEVPESFYRDTINERAAKGERYVGFLPVKSGPTGKLLSLALVFEQE